MIPPTTVAATFARTVGRAPAGVWWAPGRVNLIGEHTDCNDGFGGCPITLVDRARTPEVDAALRPAFADHGFEPPVTSSAVPAGGARRRPFSGRAAR